MRWLDPAGGAHLLEFAGRRDPKGAASNFFLKSCRFPGQSLAEGFCRQASDLSAVAREVQLEQCIPHEKGG